MTTVDGQLTIGTRSCETGGIVRWLIERKTRDRARAVL